MKVDDQDALCAAVVRPMQAQDLVPVLHLVQLVPEAPAWTTEEFRKLVATSPVGYYPAASAGAVLLRRAWVAEANTQVLGLVVIQCLQFANPHATRPGTAIPSDEPGALSPAAECEVESILVHPEARRIGIARHLLAAGMEWCCQQHAEILRLEVRRSNRAAIGLYEQAGFITTGARPGYYQQPEEDAMLMQLRFVKT